MASAFYMNDGDLNSGPHACETGTLTTESFILSEDLNNFSVDDEAYWICLIQRVFLLNSLSSLYPAYSVLKLNSCML